MNSTEVLDSFINLADHSNKTYPYNYADKYGGIQDQVMMESNILPQLAPYPEVEDQIVMESNVPSTFIKYPKVIYLTHNYTTLVHFKNILKLDL